MNWSQIYTKEINKKGGLKSFIERKEKRSAGALINRLKGNLRPNSKILEIGTGTGAIGALLTKYSFDVTAIDNDSEMVEIAKKSFNLYTGESSKVLKMDANKIKTAFGYKEFDCVISHGMLEHYSDEQIINFLSDQLYISKIVVFVVPTNQMSTYYKNRGLGDERYLPTNYWKNLLQNNFKLKNSYGFGFKETKYPQFLESILKFPLLNNSLIKYCAFNEFWISEIN